MQPRVCLAGFGLGDGLEELDHALGYAISQPTAFLVQFREAPFAGSLLFEHALLFFARALRPDGGLGHADRAVVG